MVSLITIAFLKQKTTLEKFKLSIQNLKQLVAVIKETTARYKTMTEEDLSPFKLLKAEPQGRLPLDSLVLAKFLSPLVFSDDFMLKTNELTAKLSLKYFYWFSVFLRFELSHVFSPTDISAVAFSSKTISFNYIFSCFFSNLLLTVSIPNNYTSVVCSLSQLFSGFTWSERELSEFYNLFFIGLRDSRRLLTDYAGQFHGVDDQYKTTIYSGLTQELYK